MCSEYTWQGVRNHRLVVPRVRSNPCFSNIRFVINYVCKQGLCNKSSVRMDSSICALDQVIENWSHLCKLYNNQEEYGSVTPGRKETSSAIRHKAGLEAANASVSEGGYTFPVAGLREKKKRHFYTMMATENLCAYFKPTKTLSVPLKICQDCRLYYIY